MIDDIIDFFKSPKGKFSISCILILTVIILFSYFTTPNSDPKPDNNIYLNETVTFARNVEFTVVGMAVFTSQEDGYDEDGDELSEFILSLQIEIQQTFNNWRNRNRTIKPEMFKLKSVNLEAKSRMGIFFQAMANTTFSILVGGALGEFPNIIETPLDFVQHYVEGVVTNTIFKKDFKPIKLPKNYFENKKLTTGEKELLVLEFPIKQSYLESNNAIVLAIDTVWNFEKKIFLMPRPNLLSNYSNFCAYS